MPPLPKKRSTRPVMLTTKYTPVSYTHLTLPTNSRV